MHDFRGFCVYRSESSYNILLPIDSTDEHKSCGCVLNDNTDNLRFAFGS